MDCKLNVLGVEFGPFGNWLNFSRLVVGLGEPWGGPGDWPRTPQAALTCAFVDLAGFSFTLG